MYAATHCLLHFLIHRVPALKDALEEFANTPKYQRLVIDFEKGEGESPLVMIMRCRG
jgi:hypothetical protein